MDSYALQTPPQVAHTSQTPKEEREREIDRERERYIMITMASYKLQQPPREAHTSHLGQTNGPLCIHRSRLDLFMDMVYGSKIDLVLK